MEVHDSTWLYAGLCVVVLIIILVISNVVDKYQEKELNKTLNAIADSIDAFLLEMVIKYGRRSDELDVLWGQFVKDRHKTKGSSDNLNILFEEFEGLLKEMEDEKVKSFVEDMLYPPNKDK